MGFPEKGSSVNRGYGGQKDILLIFPITSYNFTGRDDRQRSICKVSYKGQN